MKEFWDERYSVKDYVYGTEPNRYFKSVLESLNPGKILLPGEGEGRNAVYAAEKGWQVIAFDTSKEGKNKAELLSKKRGVSVKYYLKSYLEFEYVKDQFDAIGLFFTHQPSDMRKVFHSEIIKVLKPGGVLILEAFEKNQIKRNTGGPGNLDFLFSKQEILEDFNELEVVESRTLTRKLDEGLFHQGDADIIQLFLRKQF